MNKIVTFGEIMLRLSTPNFLRFGQAREFDVIYGGGESNVAVSLANFGLDVEFITRIPDNPIGSACLQYLRQYNVGTKYILYGGSRLGIYFLETGSVMRGSQVVYDRDNSSFSKIQPGMINWSAVLSGASWFHWTGITPSISETAAAVCLEGLQFAREKGITISCDLNYREKLWKWGKSAQAVMEELVHYCDVLIGNEEDAEKVLGISAPQTNVINGEVPAEGYVYVCDKLSQNFPRLHTIAITLRGSISASFNTWSAILYNNQKVYFSPKYEITHIVDRVGGGDSFVAGLIFGLNSYFNNPQKALDFAVASSALKHTIFGDFNLVSVAEVQKLMSGDRSGRVSR